ncbi:MAG: hypothetical protein UW07_C0008G0009 [Candidatus Nomurabacteria bacterium GW2011_GWF2_43_8]|uniref:Uncharacterized protein n=2 Tax=Candidatus Nomuraibacteriota TaxID=1752729 RepID=A0A0G1HYS3_9BACT|nr:MAG: hypothetical protein UV76_C0023G0010 [Candidatus Nomurabacteria bacterium GW2011_GWA2_43_15]KKT24787.1 MAG: hypothetical protein UW07_C0008G0009 [Candidatus Nomurabacteria bacterium GW2011_GWF2_43_8]
MKDNKGFIGIEIVIAIIAVLAVGFGSYVYYQKNYNKQCGGENNPCIPNPTTASDLKIYSNKDFNVSFKYPKEWTMVGPNSLPTLNLYLTIKPKNVADNRGVDFVISPISELDKFFPSITKEEIVIKKEEIYSKNGLMGKLLTFTQKGPTGIESSSSTTILLIGKNNRTYAWTTNESVLEKYFNQIINTIEIK